MRLEPSLLHIETSSRTCSVALSTGADIVGSLTSDVPNGHSAALAVQIVQLLESRGLRPSQLSGVSVSIGPGSYTGLRVGLSTAKAICFATGCPLLAIDTLHSLADTALAQIDDRQIRYVATLDARRQDAYAGVFGEEGDRLAEDFFLTVGADALEEYLVGNDSLVLCGEGLEKWKVFKADKRVQFLPLECHAENLVRLALSAFREGRFADLASCVPKYLKAPNITTAA